MIPAKISATNVQLPAGTLQNLANPQTLTNFISQSVAQLTNIPVNGTYNMYAQFCEPEKYVAANNKKLQLLVHGSQRTHAYFNLYDYATLDDATPGTGQPYHGANYSWIATASQNGYPTLAIDRLGCGKSDHPDPLAVVQFPAQVETIQATINQVNAGFLGRNFTEVMYEGRSAGSVLGQLFTAKYPQDCKRTILTGWTSLNAQTLAAAAAPAKASGAGLQPLSTPLVYGTLPAGYNTKYGLGLCEQPDVLRRRHEFRRQIL